METTSVPTANGITFPTSVTIPDSMQPASPGAEAPSAEDTTEDSQLIQIVKSAEHRNVLDGRKEDSLNRIGLEFANKYLLVNPKCPSVYGAVIAGTFVDFMTKKMSPSQIAGGLPRYCGQVIGDHRGSLGLHQDHLDGHRSELRRLLLLFKAELSHHDPRFGESLHLVENLHSASSDLTTLYFDIGNINLKIKREMDEVANINAKIIALKMVIYFHNMKEVARQTEIAMSKMKGLFSP